MARKKQNNSGNNNGLVRVFGLEIGAGLWYRAALMAVVVAALFFALWGRLLPERVRLELGVPAPETVTAPRSAFYNDTTATEELRAQAEARVPDQYNSDAAASDLALRTVNDVFSMIRRAREEKNLVSLAEKLEWVHNRLDLRVSDRTLLTALEAEPGALDRMEDAATRIVRSMMLLKIRDNTDDLEQARAKAQDEAAKLPMERRYQQAVAEIAGLALRPNLIYDADATMKARQAASDAVKPVRGYIELGEVVVYEGQTVTRRHLDICEALGLTQPQIDYFRGLAVFAFLCLLVAGCTYFIGQFAPRYLREIKHLTIAAGLTVAASIVYRLSQGTAAFEAISLGTATGSVVSMCLLAEPVVAVALAAMLSVLLGLVAAGSDARLVIVALLATTLTIYSMGRGYRRTSMIARTAAIAALANAVLLLLGDEVFGVIISWRLVVQAAVAGLLGTMVGTGLILVIQRPLQITTDMWLLELGNPNEPVLRQLLTEAPGTYQSSLMVATLAEAAAEAIGVNALLARTAAIYHDIGKVKRPGFFIENQFGVQNPHDKLTPEVSAMILASHVQEGVEMGEQLRLPREIISAIQQHHGTSLMAYFYEKARQLAKPGEEVPEGPFRYPGPKPQTKENAIIMLADCVEAAARTLDSYDAETIHQMVGKVVQDKVEDGQLDEAPITMKDLMAIEEQLVETLVGIFHRRIPYPDQVAREIEAREQARREPLEHRVSRSGVKAGNARGRH
jgi:putative nucleotidyltransferase with HDIG domain